MPGKPADPEPGARARALLRTRLLLLGGAGLVAATALAGCSGSADEPTDGSTDGSSASAPADGFTPPGTQLAIGEAATVPLTGGTAVIELRVVSIQKASPDLLRTLPGTPYFVRLEATALDGDAHDFFAERFVTAWAGDVETGAIQSPVTVGSCSRTYFGADAAVGASIEPCLTMVVEPGGSPIDRIAFTNDDDYQLPDESSVEWG